MKTIGLSPKVYVPAAAEALAGVVLILLGFDVEGRSLVAAALATLGIGYRANPAPVEVNVGPASDDLLDKP